MSSFIKLNNAWVQPTSFYKKENGAWVSITENEMIDYLSQNPVCYGGQLAQPNE